MDIVFAPVKISLSGYSSARLHNQLPWPDELTNSLECMSLALPGQLKVLPELLDARSLTAEAPEQWLTCAPSAWLLDTVPWTLLAVLPFTGAATLDAQREPSQRHWQASASAWLTDWLALQGMQGSARVGWPLPARHALVQLFKADVLDVLRNTLALQIAEGEPELAWEPGVISLTWTDATCVVPTLGLPRDTALYAALMCLKRQATLGAAAAI